ncbi:hypothetical protein BR93DRAFT_536052 [Coniochaeta sp. PMI_546]|nr:hypothetical protein BR93DRAFT_536052 [Coniochaeta sp. PMI_546]
MCALLSYMPLYAFPLPHVLFCMSYSICSILHVLLILLLVECGTELKIQTHFPYTLGLHLNKYVCVCVVVVGWGEELGRLLFMTFLIMFGTTSYYRTCYFVLDRIQYPRCTLPGGVRGRRETQAN